MAEEDTDAQDDIAEEEEGEQGGGPIQGGQAAKEKPKEKKGKCNPRIDELARPRKWALLALWKAFADTFDPERKEALRQRIQEEFCMTPEETERYVASQKKSSDSKRKQSERLKEIRKEKAMGREEAYCLFKKFLKKAMLYACTHVAPPLVSPLLRYMSESILVLLCEIHCVDPPKRCDKTNLGQYLIALSDWAAIFLAHIYYEVDLDENTEKEKLKEMEAAAAEEEDEEDQKEDDKTEDAPNEGDETETEAEEKGPQGNEDEEEEDDLILEDNEQDNV